MSCPGARHALDQSSTSRDSHRRAAKSRNYDETVQYDNGAQRPGTLILLPPLGRTLLHTSVGYMYVAHAVIESDP